jgi:hypothetical protein
MLEKFEGSYSQAMETTIIALYIAASPLIFGLIIDAIRHSLEHFNGWLSRRKSEKGPVSWIKETAKWMKNACVLWSHWDHLPEYKLSVTFREEFIAHIINIYAVQYHKYEFLDNLALSILAGLVVFLIGADAGLGQKAILFLVILSICIVLISLGWLMSRQNKSLIDQYFLKKYPSKLLIEKGLLIEREYFTKLKKAQAEYQAISND